jgi:uncharacterized RDD family membrane protein YckC
LPAKLIFVLTDTFNNTGNTEEIEFAPFWTRAGAYFMDSLLISMIALPLNFLNITEYKSFPLYLAVALVSMLYKPLMEYYYAATIGKLFFKLRVSDHDFNRITLGQSFIRSLNFIIPSLLYIPVYYLAFNNPELISISDLEKFTEALITSYPWQNNITTLTILLFLTEIILLLFDNSGKKRSFHDRVAHTYVIKKTSGTTDSL